MTEQEAQQAFTTIVSIYGLHPERVAEVADTWVLALTPMRSDIVVSILTEWISGRGPEKLPTIVEFAQAVQTIQRRDTPRAPATPTSGREKPLWVYAWEIIVAEWEGEPGTHPVLPEQKAGFDALVYRWPPEGRRVIAADTDEYRELMGRARDRMPA